MKKKIVSALQRLVLFSLVLVAGLLAGPATMLVAGDQTGQNWRTANRESAGLAPHPDEETGAVIQVYAARTYGWRGAFAVHTWVATKREGATSYQTHHVMGWRSGSKVVSRTDIPDRHWFGSRPDLIVDLRGEAAASQIDAVEAAVASYPYADTYTAWPGPNSNTFVAWIGREVPALRLEMPPHAIGKDYLGRARFAGMTPSGTGVQISILGLLGVGLALREGLEINILGLSFGIDPQDLNLKLPGIGRIGPSPDPVRSGV